MNTIAMTRENDRLHITYQNTTVVLPISQGFSYQDANLILGEHSLPCSRKDYKKLVKAYHNSLKPKRSAHAVWAASTFACVFTITFALLLMGLSAQPLQEPIPETGTNIISIDPLYSPDSEQSSTPSPGTSDEDYFPFGNS